MVRATRVFLRLSRMAISPPHDPLIAIIGTTGTGKSQLAVDLALHFNGEVINGDAVQMYDGLPVITNKIPVDERKGVPHHLLGCVGLDEPTWRVDRFVDEALDAIRDIRSRGRTPILVGGTHYYTQSLLFRNGLLDAAQARGDEEQGSSSENDSSDKWPILSASPEEMYQKLREVDPVMASRWHPNDKRHVRRSLEIWLKTGKRASEIYAEQQSPNEFVSEKDDTADESATADPGLRFPTILLWTHTPTIALYQRLDERVKAMHKSGLVEEARELDEFAIRQIKSGNPIDKTRGIFIAIGYRQFLPLIDFLRNTHDLASSNDDAAEAAKLTAQGIEQTQAATRRYAKSQLRWLRIKLVNALRPSGADRNVYVLDSSDTEAWEAKVLDPATRHVRDFLEGRPPADTYAISTAVEDTLRPLRDYDLSRRRDLWQRQVCELCGVTTVTEEDWLQHIKSSRHGKAAKRRRQREGREELHGQSEPG